MEEKDLKFTKIKYNLKSKTPLHQGSDDNTGNVKTFRRMRKYIEPIQIKSNFKDANDRRNAIVDILVDVWFNIDKENIKEDRMRKIWDEFSSKLVASTNVQNKYQFLTKLCEKWDIRSLDNIELVNKLNSFNDDELLQTIRDEYQILVLLTRIRKDALTGRDIITIQDPSTENEIKEFEFVKSFIDIPFISANSIKGILRRLLMYDFCRKVGITKLSEDTYYMLFAGGSIKSSGVEDIEKRNNMIKMCPPLGLLGSAVGDMTIEGNIAVGLLFPNCIENDTGNVSFWSLLDTMYGTRNDSAKTEKEIEIVREGEKEKHQMIYYYEVLVSGTVFEHQIILKTTDELQKSCFYQMFELFKQFPFLGGMDTIGNGEMEIYNLNIPSDGYKEYIDYLQKNKDEIRNFWESFGKIGKKKTTVTTKTKRGKKEETSEEEKEEDGMLI